MRGSAFHLRLVLAVLGWLAQACLPVVHAATMAEPRHGLGWCGLASPALQAKLAQLPLEIRQIIDQDGMRSASVEQCGELCAAAGGAPLPSSAPITVTLRAAGLEPATVAVPSHTPHPLESPPPVRGPPSIS